MSEEDDDEMLYREMNPDDEFYMGDPADKEYSDEPDPKPDPKYKSGGCAGVFLSIVAIVVIGGYALFVYLF